MFVWEELLKWLTLKKPNRSTASAFYSTSGPGSKLATLNLPGAGSEARLSPGLGLCQWPSIPDRRGCRRELREAATRWGDGRGAGAPPAWAPASGATPPPHPRERPAEVASCFPPAGSFSFSFLPALSSKLRGTPWIRAPWHVGWEGFVRHAHRKVCEGGQRPQQGGVPLRAGRETLFHLSGLAGWSDAPRHVHASPQTRSSPSHDTLVCRVWVHISALCQDSRLIGGGTHLTAPAPPPS